MPLERGVSELFDRPGGARRIAVVPAYNEEPTVAQVLDKLSHFVDELVVVDDGSTDRTRAEIQAWLPGHDHARLLTFDYNQGMSAAYYLAFSDLRRRMRDGELSPDDLVFTVDADGQHDLDVIDDLHRRTVEEQLDGLLVRRDLSTYPRYKQLGNGVLSAWATLWAGHPLYDVESGYRIFRLGALADALTYYRGHKYSETVEVAVVLCRLGYRVRNDVLVPVPVYRSRTRMVDVFIDLAAIPTAAFRVSARRPPGKDVPSLVPPLAATVAAASAGVATAVAVVRGTRRLTRRVRQH
jgi:glycosyltransferase involved in cell wall biosynthesis